MSGWKRARREDGVDLLAPADPLAFKHSERYPAGESVWERTRKPGIEGVGPMHNDVGRNISSQLLVPPKIELFLQRQDVGPPAKFGKILAELQRPQDATTAPLRGKVIGDHENVVHEPSVNG